MSRVVVCRPAIDVSDGAARYPHGTVRALLDTDLVTPPTRRALLDRIEERPVYSPRRFSVGQFATLAAVAERLLPQHGRPSRVDIAAAIDERLDTGASKGWRYDVLPPDAEAYVRAMDAFDADAVARYRKAFVDSDGDEQDTVIRAVQRGDVTTAHWRALDATRLFEELLAECTEIYYADPIVQSDIGYTGMADAHGFTAIGLNQLEAFEPRELR